MTLQTALVAVRALHFCATAILWGGGGLLCLLKSGSPAATSAAATPRRNAGTLVRGAALLAALTGGAWLAVTLVTITDDPASLVDSDAWTGFWTSAFGLPWAIRMALLAAVIVLAAIPRRTAPSGLCALGLGLAIDQAWLGHAATGTGVAGFAMLGADALHVAAAYAWTGALPVLGLMLLEAGHGSYKSATSVKTALDLFSTIGGLAVATILASGIVNASFRIDMPMQLVTTPYGRLLCLKIALFATMIGLAWVNRRLARTIAALPNRLTTARTLVGCVAIETLVGILILCAAAALGVQAPPG